MAVDVHCATLAVDLATGPDIADITTAICGIVVASGVREGSVQATAVGSTASITTIEYEPGAIADLKAALNRLAPPGADYAHEMAWHDGNGHSHLQAALLGPSLSLPVRGGQIRLGPWQQVILINHDNRPRRLSVEVTVIGIR